MSELRLLGFVQLLRCGEMLGFTFACRRGRPEQPIAGAELFIHSPATVAIPRISRTMALEMPDVLSGLHE